MVLYLSHVIKRLFPNVGDLQSSGKRLYLKYVWRYRWCQNGANVNFWKTFLLLMLHNCCISCKNVCFPSALTLDGLFWGLWQLSWFVARAYFCFTSAVSCSENKKLASKILHIYSRLISTEQETKSKTQSQITVLQQHQKSSHRA